MADDEESSTAPPAAPLALFGNAKGYLQDVNGRTYTYTPIPPGCSKEWHSTVGESTRKQMISKLVDGICSKVPASESSATTEKMRLNIIQRARAREQSCYVNADSAEDYYNSLTPLESFLASVARSATDDSERRKIIRKRLTMILHAQRCRKNKRKNAADITKQQWQCNLSICKILRNALDHIPTCKEGEECTVQHCATSRKIIGHWNHCKRSECPVCRSVRQSEKNYDKVLRRKKMAKK